ncbi:CRISPR-associated protein Cas1 [Ammonifex degensii KC4]|uniref:CRISPR-associated endonuclease Cas1 n=1 Tax=Ammonifex degensii (strain DSM 10501 / KC4) TaxID=429009 RepID=C9R977_AMMDK|nr:CRISPR-associated endonuclease Cas1 [Ammonifex degensii]ACX52856.1 CRISPR-associated protein Cas1 [Ammonifex degensii KC4]
MIEVVVLNFGTVLGKKSERLVIREQGKVVKEIPFRDISALTIAARGVSLSSDVIRECIEHGIQINFLTSSGRPYAKVTSPQLSGTVVTRREQILAYNDARGAALAIAFVEGKLKNQANVLKYFAKYRRVADPALYAELEARLARLEAIRSELESLSGTTVEELRGTIFSIEGRAAQEYWDGVRLLLGERVEFTGRERRGAEDPVNAALNYGYGILYSHVWGAVMLAGLEPFAGFLHTDRPGKPSLVLDLTEEFRACVVDRTIVGMLLRGGTVKMEEGRLTDETRRELARRVLERLEAEETYEGRKHKLRTIIQRQARCIASFLRGERRYKPFVARW